MSPSRNSQSAEQPRGVETIRTLLRSSEVARALQEVGDRWSHLIMRDAFLGVRRFEDLRRRTGASRGTLTARLNSMVNAGLLYRTPYGEGPNRLEYRLTEKGLAFYPVALCMWMWENRWAGEYGLPPRLVHSVCGKTLQPALVCAACGEPVRGGDIEYRAGPGAFKYAAATSTTRRRESAAPSGDGVDTTMFHCVDTVGDRWATLLLGALFFGLHRYDDINAALGIATNILADRLRRLLSAGVIEQRLYQDNPPRYEYHLTDKGRDLLNFTTALQEWGTRWLPAPYGPAILLIHRPCNRRLRSRIVCGNCGDEVDPREVQIRASATHTERKAAPRRRPQRRRRSSPGKRPVVRRTKTS
ncbi:MAG TPA: helix-turn-helix domain-containing protein [Steroidobacter sp.]|nr:helix-turn-helix domain-containing protein [Steroidobacter sp.]